jgi:ComF family protein
LIYAYSYQEPMTEVIRALKFRGADFLGRDLAAALAELHGEAFATCHLVTAVPLSWRRLLQRGYNQAEAIARPLAAELGMLCPRLLSRRHSSRQSALSRRSRLRNPGLRFEARSPVTGRRVLLVDDVLTTGATLAGAAQALRAAGALAVVGTVAARTPRRREATLPTGVGPETLTAPREGS